MLNTTDQFLIKGVPWNSYKPKDNKDKFSLSHLQNKSFSYNTALSMAEASKLSYENEKTIQNTVRTSWGFTCFDFLDVGSTQGFIAQTQDVILISFRGTESTLEDWLGNMDIRTTKKPYGYVHKGFEKHYSNIAAKLLAILASSNSANKTIWLTGHSLGGAIATIAAAELKGQYDISGIHTFGQPRVGFDSLRLFIEANYSENYHRFVNQNDPVPKLPWKGARDWQDVGQLIHFTGTATVSPTIVNSKKMAGGSPSMSHADYNNLLQNITKFKQELKAKRSMIIRPKLRDKPIDNKWPMDISNKFKKIKETKEKNATQQKGQALNVDDHSIDNYITALHKLSQTPVS